MDERRSCCMTARHWKILRRSDRTKQGGQLAGNGPQLFGASGARTDLILRETGPHCLVEPDLDTVPVLGYGADVPE
jgi:hypothetical protein